MKNNFSVKLLIILLLFLGVGAVFGGSVLMLSPSGKWFGMPLSMLDHSPFNNFLIPGVILLVVLGIVPVAVAMALIKKPLSQLAQRLNVYKDMYWGWTFTVYLAFALIIWIQVEMTVLRAVHWSHSVYILVGIAILFVAIMPQVRNQYKQRM